MNINFNSIQANTTTAAQGVRDSFDAGQVQGKTESLSSYDLTISLAETAIEDIKAADVPPDALRRDDDIGRLVSMAFSLPPPPFPTV